MAETSREGGSIEEEDVFFVYFLNLALFRSFLLSLYISQI
jgi:hypothetical protein